MAGKGHKFGESPYGRPTLETYDDDTVTIVVPRKAAEDLYYAIALAIGSRAGFGHSLYAEWAPGKKGGRPRGKGSPDEEAPPGKNGKPSGPRPKG
jgi:hypothetical protein